MPVRESTTDLLIIGGGTAGLTLGIMARQMGLTAGVVEAATYPRVAHGDTLPSGIDGYFKMIGIRASVSTGML